MRLLAIAAGMVLAGCAADESRPVTEADLAGRVLTVPDFNGPESGVLQLMMAEGGTLEVSARDDRNDESFSETGVWRVNGGAFCVQLPVGSRLASHGREECAPMFVDGVMVRFGGGPGRDAFRGTLSEGLE